MLRTINPDHQSSLMPGKVSDEFSDWSLAAKVNTKRPQGS